MKEVLEWDGSVAQIKSVNTLKIRCMQRSSARFVIFEVPLMKKTTKTSEQSKGKVRKAYV